MTPPDLPSLSETVHRHGLAARKALGQHFLLDEALCGRIARLAGTFPAGRCWRWGRGRAG